MNTLEKLGLKYKTDKGTKHNYLPVYFSLFSKPKEVKKVLEIGTAEGASIKMWHDFFPNAKIYGADIDEKRVEILNYLALTKSRIQGIQCDQSKAEDLLDLINLTHKDLDLVVDDGSHDRDHQIFTCQTLIPLLQKGCIYVIEDVEDGNIYAKLGITLKNITDMKMLKLSKRYDDRLIIIKI